MGAEIAAPGAAQRALPGFGNCFGCAPENHKGLKLDLRAGGGAVSAQVCLGEGYESFPGIVHGGIIATVLDEVMARASLEATGLPAMTVGMRLRFIQVMRSGVPHLAQATVVSSDGNLVRVEGQLSAASGGLVAAAEATFFLWSPEQLASGKMGLPPETLETINAFLSQTRTR